MVTATHTAPGWERYAWVAGVLYVLAVVAESAVGLGVGINQNDSAAKIARELADHRTGSLFAFAAGVLLFRSGVLPRWLAWVSILVAILLFVQAFGLGGLMASFGLVLDLIGFVLLLLFVLASCVILLRRESSVRYAGG